ncbi:MAG: hypothetical protein RL717_100 [Pseudomonadota bacterium]
MVRNRVMALLTCVGVVSTITASLAVAQANDPIQWGVTISSGMSPPPVLYERPQPPRAEFVWVNGFWYWSYGAYSWVPGRWEPARAGHLYSQPSWHQGPGGWNFQPGRWQHGGLHAYRDNGPHHGYQAGRVRDQGLGHGREYGQGHRHGHEYRHGRNH